MSKEPVTGAWSLLLTCEHGGNRVPPAYRHLFVDADEALASHRGWDAGSLTLARDLAHRTGAPLHAATLTRLLVDLNRSPHNPRVFSPWTRTLPGPERRSLLEAYHRPHWQQVFRAVDDAIQSGGRLLHLGIHSFTPMLNGVARRPDLALLYDPVRDGERTLCAAWVGALRKALPGMRVHRNDPYRGASDGLTTALRRRHGGDAYLGVEVEVSHGVLDPRGRVPPPVVRALHEGLVEAAGQLGWPGLAPGPY